MTRIRVDDRWYEVLVLASFSWMYPYPDPWFPGDAVWFSAEVIA